MITGTTEAWESGELGNEMAFAKKVSPELAEEINNSLGLQMISIRLNKDLIEKFKLMGEFHGIGYQPLMRDALQRFADSEMKAIITGFVESQKANKQKEAEIKKTAESQKADGNEKTAHPKKVA